MTSTYHVDAHDPRYRALFVTGADFAPTVDGSALMGCWHREKFAYLAPELARHLGALVAVVRDPADVPDLIGGLANAAQC